MGFRDDVIERLEQLAAARATGRMAVRSVAGSSWVHLHDGRLYCAERSGQPTLLVAMAEAGLFTPEEWQLALRLPFGPSWDALVDGDGRRLAELAAFARAAVVEVVAGLAVHQQAGATVTFSPGVHHSFGRLGLWSLADIRADAPASPPREQVPLVDRAEFLELLEEVSPHVRRLPGSDVRIVAGKRC